ncbi:UDP-4-amino-4,6-dideoxy-N-acetyl-beta-L-altrosamine transaminase [Hwanghaeella grinnelliae]|uniref:UDP-4-amino-4, 6-dideoxy-N-acetyl-beta-L-altrosamine transaminase n=1 Tax=Hwanghaeella grinnelliae TaxID=2500179 RepID=A0A3S2WSH0_9PROT|nr:UDP-4-amino-4,6-dideoxy-N-acetyl-beta-L-altrosamine transaminase [Hwanghaeella grinnelliae]RVU36768.1 UDP-4-amino-4,6-dideoxy-N-acetyl-beta-L-altrosamine transaminase [Hwanghaeella grinnelliae]
MERAFLPYGRQQIDQADIDAVVGVLTSPYLTTGPNVASFEAALAKAVGADHAIACANGTAALHMAYHAFGVGPETSVIVPTTTFAATASTADLLGAEVVFADVDPDTGLMTPETAQEAISRASFPVRCITPVHLAGQMEDMAAMRALADSVGAYLLADACHALGTVSDEGWRVGACPHTHVETFSFHPVKTIAAGEGGAVTTSDAKLAQKMRRFGNHGIVRTGDEFTYKDLALDAETGAVNPWYYELAEPALNYRLSDIQCALAESQLAKLPQFVERRRALADLYDRAFSTSPAPVKPFGRTAANQPAWHLYVTLIDFDAIGKSRAAVMNALRERGVGTQVHYIPLILQPHFRCDAASNQYPGSLAYYRRALSIPLFPSMTDDDAEYVVRSIESVLEP